ncbi:MAG: endolytic transglycosylase MltG [Desulfohalobiaceae bacterium]|nr:endolytic transglycosylase MltG [Desulfohalobiaceae bacterium]
MNVIRFLFFFAISVLCLFSVLYAYRYLAYPIQAQGREKVVTIQPGDSFQEVARLLAAKKIISDSFKFRILGRITGKGSRVQAGEFLVDTGWSRLRLLDELVKGRSVLYTLSIPEGLPWWETGKLIQKEGLTSLQSFQQAIHDKNLLQKFNIPAENAEGYLFPETYSLPRPRKDRAGPIVDLMLTEFRRRVQSQIWPKQLPEAETIHRIVTLASIIEKETAQEDERGRISGVYKNRLEKGMRLQCDPTVIYGLGPDFNGNLTRKDLQDKSNEYNTYRSSGLPPGPICSPGLASLLAAVNPEEHDYLYFVAKDDGSHHFSRTLAEHNRAVRKYQLN